MSLLNLQTDLKSLKFGVGPSYDRPGLGNSGQPYITSPIPPDNPPSPGTVLDQINDFLTPTPNSPDFLLRGGISAARDTATDVLRLGKFFSNLNSSAGISFVAKQNSLSQIAVRTQAGGKIQNEGAYTPLSTLAQAGINFVGGHVKKQSGITTYLEATKQEEPLRGFGKKIISTANNRLYQLYESKVASRGELLDDLDYNKINSLSPLPTALLSYNGGPNSALGVGSTTIKIATDNYGAPLQTGINNIQLQKLGFFPPIPPDPAQRGGDMMSSQRGPMDKPPLSGKTGFGAFEGKDIFLQDFRRDLYHIGDQEKSTITGIAPAYNNGLNTIDGRGDSRINYISPGQKGNIISYTTGKVLESGEILPVDKINAQPIYKSGGVKSEPEISKNDLIKFRIAAVLRNGQKVYMHFRAYINTFSDSYEASWDSLKYMGRGEDFYKYNGFGRKVSLSFTVAAQSKPELMAQYKKLNFLASTLAPDYGNSGYMGGVMTTLTVGGWCYELPGFINSLNLDVPEESPWEIAIDDKLEGGKGSGDGTVKEMPHIVNVSMDYTPIHKFRPELQKNRYNDDGFVEETFDSNGVLSRRGYGKQRFIALTNGISENYDDTYRKEGKRRKIGD